MAWETKKILLTVKAHPVQSKKYRSTVCIAGITEDNHWIRLYPVPFRMFFRSGSRFKKYVWIEAEVRKSRRDSRRESYKIRPSTVRLVDESLNKPEIDWEARNEAILSMKTQSIESLDVLKQEENASLGLIRPKIVLDFSKSDRPHIRDSDSTVQTDLEGRAIPIAEPMDVYFRYHFRCDDRRCNTTHCIMCEDWELYEAWRTWRYPSEEEKFVKIRNKFFRWMVEERNLYFFVGTHAIYRTWLIIGVYYPPK